MNRHNIEETARAIAQLDVWRTAAAHNWALVPQMSELPYLVMAGVEKDPDGKGPVAGRLLLFPGVENFRHFVVSQQVPDFGVWMSPLEFEHTEVIAKRDGGAEIFVYHPGFVPQPPTEAERAFLAPLLYECYGMLLRVESDPELPLRYFRETRAMFARKEVVDGVWQDGPLKMPPDGQLSYVERVAIPKDLCERAAKLPVAAGEVWETDFVMIPTFHTNEERPRFLYVFAAVDAALGTRVVWVKMSVGGTEAALKALWEGHAARFLEAMVRLGRAPAEIHVRSGRLARFLRPMCLHVPFKLVQQSRLPVLDSVLGRAVKMKTV